MRLILYIVRRLLILIPTLLGVTIITFTLSHAFGPNLAIAVYCTPKLGACDINNPLLQPIVQQFHLRDPIPAQYVYYMQGLLSGDWGYTTPAIKGGMPVTQAISIFFPQTVNLGGTYQLFSQPTHFLVLDAALHGSWAVFMDALRHLVLPTATLTIGILGVILRMVRSGMVDSMNQDYVRTAWAKGLPDWVVTRTHIRRNALLPAATVIGLLFAGLLGGVVLVEDVFAWPGIGYWATQAILGFDAGGIMGTTLIFALFLVLINLAADVIYAYLDPRISL